MPILDEMLAIFGRDSVTVNIYSLHFCLFYNILLAIRRCYVEDRVLLCNELTLLTCLILDRASGKLIETTAFRAGKRTCLGNV
jgi:hypothetical protein